MRNISEEYNGWCRHRVVVLLQINDEVSRCEHMHCGLIHWVQTNCVGWQLLRSLSMAVDEEVLQAPLVSRDDQVSVLVCLNGFGQLLSRRLRKNRFLCNGMRLMWRTCFRILMKSASEAI